MNQPSIWLAAFLWLPAALFAADQPNILFLLADDQRPDTIHALGNPRIDTPNLDSLVERGLTFTEATCSYPICVVSRAEILTGMHGWENGVDGIRNQFEPGVSFWAQTLQEAGYRTCYVGKWHTSGRPSARGYGEVRALFSGGGGKWWEEGQTDWKGSPITGYRGWVFQSEDGKEKYPEKGVGLTPDIDSKFADGAIDFLKSEQDPDKPWFLHVNFTAPHDPLFIPPGLEGKYKASDMALPGNFAPEHPFDHGNLHGRDEELMAFPRTEESVKDLLRVYYSVIDYLDQQVGRILQALEESGQLENTLVIYSSDHGMSVGSHGLRGKQNMYEHTIHVPFIIAGPGIPKGEKSDARIYLRELYPTTCELAGIPIPEAVTAKSFMGVLSGETSSHQEEIFGYYKDSQRMIHKDGWKLVEYPLADRTHLFELKTDPLELNNRVDDPEQAARLRSLRNELEDWRQELGDPMLSQ